MVDVAKGGLDEIKKDGAGAKEWAQEAAGEQEEWTIHQGEIWKDGRPRQVLDKLTDKPKQTY